MSIRLLQDFCKTLRIEVCSIRLWSFGARVRSADRLCQGGLTRENYGATIILAVSRCGWLEVEFAEASPTGKQTTSVTMVGENPVHINDLNATILHCLGIDHERLSFSFQGLENRLTGWNRNESSAEFWHSVIDRFVRLGRPPLKRGVFCARIAKGNKGFAAARREPS